MATTGKRIADTIQQHMERQGINTHALHLQTGISYNTLKGRLNTGHHLGVEELRLIAEALNTEPHTLWLESSRGSHLEAA